MSERCLQECLGSCRGCNVLEIAKQKMCKDSITVKQAAQAVQAEYCPEDTLMQVDLINKKVIARWGGVDLTSGQS